MTRKDWLWMQSSVALMAAAARAMRHVEGAARLAPAAHKAAEALTPRAQ